jgi:CheY-like chemotaxis protein
MAHVLLIDDMAGVRRAVSTMLGRGGHTVVLAKDGNEGLAAMRSQRFDLVITDILMAGPDGSDMLFEVAALTERPKLVAMSAYGADIDQDAALRAAQLTADIFLEKPFEEEVLLAAIADLLPKAA